MIFKILYFNLIIIYLIKSLEPTSALTCADLVETGFYTIVPVSKPDYTVGLAPGSEKLDGAGVTIELNKVETASVFYKLEINKDGNIFN